MLILLSNPIFNAYQGADFLGKGIFITLLFLSILTWCLILQKFFLQREIKKTSVQFQSIFQKNSTSPLSLETRSSDHPFAALYAAFKKHSLELLKKINLLLKTKATSPSQDLISISLKLT